MLNYILLFLAVLMFAAQFASTKIYSDKVKQGIMQTFVMIAIVSIIGAVMYLLISGFKVCFSINLIIHAVSFALVMILYYILGIKVLSIGSVAIYGMFMMLGGMMLPFAYGLVFLNEPLTFGKGFGCIALSLVILIQTLIQPKEEKNKTGKNSLFVFLCIAIFILNGLTGVIAKSYTVSEILPDESGFTAISCLLTATLNIIFLFPFALKHKNEFVFEIKNALNPKVLLCTLAIGLFAHTGNFLLLKAATHLPASIQFPIVSGGVIFFSAIVSVIIFKEKICKKELGCVVLALLSTVLFAF